MIKRLINKFLDKNGYIPLIKKEHFERNIQGTMFNGLKRMKSIGINPSMIIDVGAAQGTWTQMALKMWPNSKYELVEPLIENQPYLETLKNSLNNINYHLAIAGNEIMDKVWLNVSEEDLDGSGVYFDKSNNGRYVPSITLNSILHNKAKKSIAIKLDTHGYEIPILEGAKDILPFVDLLVIEVYGFVISPTCLLFHELSAYLYDKGFRLVDVVDVCRRPGDETFWQADAFYIKKSHSVFDRNTFQVS